MLARLIKQFVHKHQSKQHARDLVQALHVGCCASWSDSPVTVRQNRQCCIPTSRWVCLQQELGLRNGVNCKLSTQFHVPLQRLAASLCSEERPQRGGVRRLRHQRPRGTLTESRARQRGLRQMPVRPATMHPRRAPPRPNAAAAAAAAADGSAQDAAAAGEGSDTAGPTPFGLIGGKREDPLAKADEDEVRVLASRLCPHF